MQQNNDVRKLCINVLDYGDLLIIANKSMGKTNTLQVLAREFSNMPNTRVLIFEDFPKHIHELDKVAYFIIKDSDVVETSHTIDMENWFLRHERDYSILKGKEIRQFLRENKHGIFLMNIADIERSAFFIYSIVNHFYRKNYLRAYKNYNTHEKIVFIIEESQNVFDSTTISKKLFNRMRKIFSVARNLNLHFVMASQRLQDLNTKIRGRTRLMFGQISLDDYELKVRRLLRNSKHRKDILTLRKGVFLYTPLDQLISFPLFKQQGKPYLWKRKQPKPQEPKKSLWKRFISAITHKSEEPVRHEPEEPETLEEQLERYDKEDAEDDSEETGSYPIFDEDFV